MKRDDSVLGLLLQSVSTITAKNAEIEKLKEEIRQLKEQNNTPIYITLNIDGVELVKKAK